jgi:hypothetical protein
VDVIEWLLDGDPLLLSEINRIVIEEAALDGGINPAVSIGTSDVCVTAMYPDYAAYGIDYGVSESVNTSRLNPIAKRKYPRLNLRNS